MTAEPGASHAKRGRPSAETLTLLQRSHATLRAELSDVLSKLRPSVDPSAPVVFGQDAPPTRPNLADRARLVELIGKLMGLLGTEIVGDDAPEDSSQAPRRRRRRVDYG